ncbi:hypothetical protein RUND412_004810 [Rhizina undulata]
MTAEILKQRLSARATVEPKLMPRKLKDRVLAIFQREKNTNIDNVRTWEAYKILEYFENKNAHISYDSSIHRLIVHCYSGAIHQAFMCTMFREKRAMYAGGFLNDDMRLLFGSNLTVNGFSRRFRDSCKIPDWYIRRRGEYIPTLICEVGWTQPYSDLIQNAKLWLEGSKGAVRLVVIVYITEEKNPSEPQNPSRARDASDPASSPEPEIEPVKSVRIAQAFIELWQYDPETSAAAPRGARVPVLPLPATSFKIFLGDILPPEFIPEGRNATDPYDVPLSEFRDLLEEAQLE